MNPGVDVRGDENLDSMPNLIISGAARSKFFRQPRCKELDKLLLTINPIAILISGTKPSPLE